MAGVQLTVNIKRLSDLRKATGLKPAQFARLAGVEQSVYSRIENGETTTPTFDTMARIAKALRVPMETFAVGLDEDDEDGGELIPFGDVVIQRTASAMADQVVDRLQTYLADAGVARVLHALNLLPADQQDELRDSIALALRRERQRRES